MSKFVVSQRSNKEFQFNLHAGNGQVILTSEGYTTRTNCLNGIDSVRKNAADANRFEKLESKNAKHYFNLKATNGQVIGTSQMYESAAGRDGGIRSVMTNAPGADIEERL